MIVRATYPFYLEEGGHIYEVGETADVPDGRAESLVARGLAEATEAAEAAEAADPSPRRRATRRTARRE